MGYRDEDIACCIVQGVIDRPALAHHRRMYGTFPARGPVPQVLILTTQSLIEMSHCTPDLARASPTLSSRGQLRIQFVEQVGPRSPRSRRATVDAALSVKARGRGRRR